MPAPRRTAVSVAQVIPASWPRISETFAKLKADSTVTPSTTYIIFDACDSHIPLLYQSPCLPFAPNTTYLLCCVFCAGPFRHCRHFTCSINVEMSFLDAAKATIETLTGDIRRGVADVDEKFEKEKHSHTHLGVACHSFHPHTRANRFHSFAPPRTGNNAKWFVDGCGYMWAVSIALEQAKESIWILDWWLSPELYLRRPPKKNETYRLDRMLLAAAQRGVKVNIIVYKEVSSVLTRESGLTRGTCCPSVKPAD